MFFKPVTSDNFKQYDPETVNLYKKRESLEYNTTCLLRLTRDYRNRLPVVASEDHPWVKNHEAYIKSIPLQIFGGYLFFTYAFF